MSGIPSWARVGAKVVCVNSDRFAEVLVRGRTYTIAAVNFETDNTAWGVFGKADAHWVIDLVEASNPQDQLFPSNHPGFDLRRFRPAVEPKSDAEIEAQIYHKKGLHQSVPRKSRADA